MHTLICLRIMNEFTGGYISSRERGKACTVERTVAKAACVFSIVSSIKNTRNKSPVVFMFYAINNAFKEKNKCPKLNIYLFSNETPLQKTSH